MMLRFNVFEFEFPLLKFSEEMTLNVSCIFNMFFIQSTGKIWSNCTVFWSEILGHPVLGMGIMPFLCNGTLLFQGHLGMSIDDNQNWRTQIYEKGGILPSLNSRMFIVRRLQSQIGNKNVKKNLMKII